MVPGSVRRSEGVWAPWQGPQQRRRALTPAITATSSIGLTEPGRIGAENVSDAVYIAFISTVAAASKMVTFVGTWSFGMTNL
jgi:hypothetical protein